MNNNLAVLSLLLLVAPVGLAQQQQADRLRLSDLKQPVETLSREHLEKLMSGARITRISARGITQGWTNQPDGTLMANSVNHSGRPFTEWGKWSVNEQGQYCLSIPWHGDQPENWCRFVVRNADGLFVVNGLAPTDRARKYEVSGGK